VVDASICLPWFLVDEASPLSEALLAEHPRLELWAPPLWRPEMANALVVAARRGRIRPEHRREMLDEVDRLEIRFDPSPPGVVTLARLATEHDLTTYDAAYLELALRRKIPLATLDESLRRAAPAAGARLFGSE
jgi:predicted nucleic acid-binding protein